MSLTTDVTGHPLYGNFRTITNDLGISQWIIKGYIWEEHILDIIRKYIRPNTTIIDIGANIGTHTVGIINHLQQFSNNTNTLIVAIEPQPFCFDILSHNISNATQTKKKINVQLLKVGLSDKDDYDVFMDMPDYRTTENPGGFGLIFDETQDSNKTKVRIHTLDSFNLTNVSFIKLDVEGHENQVLDGAYNTIQASRPVMIVEILGGCPRDVANPEQVQYIDSTINKIMSFGYKVSCISHSDYLCIPN
jgi:FkbM family methyltransferase